MSYVHVGVLVPSSLFPFASIRQDDRHSPALFSGRSREKMASKEEEDDEEEGGKGREEERIKTQEVRWGDYLD